MRKVALVVLAALVFSVYAPRVQAQPFADVPTDIFAFDAVAELAAKGIIEGYPDGTFKGDRAMTRYEMAMVVARILARIEAIKIPPPPAAPPAGVAPADLAAVQRLVNEFRAELAAQGVRVTAVEEELAALRAKLSNVKFTGDVSIRYNWFPSPPTSSTTGVPTAFYRNRTTFVGQAAPNVKATARINTGACLLGASTCGASRFSFDTTLANASHELVSFDRAYLDADLYGVSWRVGRQGYSLAPVGIQGYGLLFDPQSQCCGGVGSADGLLVKGSFASFPWEVGVWRAGTGTGTGSFGDFWTGTISASNLIPGWTFRVAGLGQYRNGSSPALANTTDTGYSADVSGTLIPGVGLGAAWATFAGYTTPTTTVSSSAYQVWVTLDLSRLAGLSMWSPTLGLQYKNYGATTLPPIPTFSGATTDVQQTQQWNFQGWAADLTLKITPALSGEVEYESGNTVITPTSAVTEWYANLTYTLAPRTTIGLNYFSQNVAGAPTVNFYRIELLYSY